MSYDGYYGVGDPEFVGNIPIRSEITVLPADEPKAPDDVHDQVIISSDGRGAKKNRPIIGFRVFETIGVGVVNLRGILSGKKSK